MDLKRLRQRCEARLRDFPFPTPFNARAFCDTLGAQRGRPIVFVSRSMPLDLTGLWVPEGGTDFILYEQDTSARHQQQIIFHEAAHIYLGHRPALCMSDRWFDLTPGLDSERIAGFLARDHPSDPEEQEAELTATLLMARLGSVAAASALATASSADPALEALVERLAADLERVS